MLRERTAERSSEREGASCDYVDDPFASLYESAMVPPVWKSSPQLLPMDNMPGAMPIDEIPFGMEDVIPAIRYVKPKCDGIPQGLDEIAPGPVLAAYLASIDVTKVSPASQLMVMRAHQRMASHYQANVYHDMAAITNVMAGPSDRDKRVAIEAAEAEIGVALHLSRRATAGHLNFALVLANRLPRLADMLSDGVIDLPRAKVIHTCTAHLSDLEAQAVLDEIADIAPELTVGQLRARLIRLCIQIDPAEATTRYEHAADARMIFALLNPSGTANLSGFDLPPERVAAITDRIDTIARNMRTAGETRTMDQLRADIFIDLLSGTGQHPTRKGAVDVRIDLSTLALLNDNPAELGGLGTVIADVARRAVKDSNKPSLRISMPTASADAPDDFTTDSRRPTAAQRRRIETRDATCVFPGCRVPSTRSDIDHIIAVQDGGSTSDTNLAPLCRYHHRIKHEQNWTYQRLSEGVYRWVSRLGQIIITTRGDPP